MAGYCGLGSVATVACSMRHKIGEKRVEGSEYQ